MKQNQDDIPRPSAGASPLAISAVRFQNTFPVGRKNLLRHPSMLLLARAETNMEMARSLRRTRGLRRLVVLFIAVFGCVLPTGVFPSAFAGVPPASAGARDQGQDAIRVDVNLVMSDTTVKNKAGQL